MISGKLAFYLAIGTIAMFVPICIQSLWYKISLWKSAVIAVLLTVTGTVGTYIMFFVENQWWGGTSFFGAIFFVPIPFVLFSILLKVPYNNILDLCAPAECIMLAIMKVQCLVSGCCRGRFICSTSQGTDIYFPSQLMELINAFILVVLLMFIASKSKNKGTIYPKYLLLYGISRFILNFFRQEFVTTEMFVPFGTIWSIVAIIVGIVWLTVLKKYKNNKKEQLLYEFKT
jgi:prolipoprotein diacylglyceryltransferase